MRTSARAAIAAAAAVAGLSGAALAGDEPGGGVRFSDAPFERALAAAKEAKKPVFVYFTLDG
jgi:hypothetical protein